MAASLCQRLAPYTQRCRAWTAGAGHPNQGSVDGAASSSEAPGGIADSGNRVVVGASRPPIRALAAERLSHHYAASVSALRTGTASAMAWMSTQRRARINSLQARTDSIRAAVQRWRQASKGAEEPPRRQGLPIPVMQPPAEPPRAFDTSATFERGTSTDIPVPWVSPQPLPSKVPAAEDRVPQFWVSGHGNAEAETFHCVSEAETEELQLLLDTTFKRIVTSDRKAGAPPNRLKLVHAHRIQNSELWRKYVAHRHGLKSKRPHRCTPLSTFGGQVVTGLNLAPFMRDSLQPRVNEVYLWHGTSPDGAVGISTVGFQLKYSGSKADCMYGPGAYFAECSSKSDEYATDAKDGLYKGLRCLLLCRVVLGEVLHLTAGGSGAHDLVRAAMESAIYDSVLGDREASVGTYREFVVYQENQVYPEYVLLYQRQ